MSIRCFYLIRRKNFVHILNSMYTFEILFLRGIFKSSLLITIKTFTVFIIIDTLSISKSLFLFRIWFLDPSKVVFISILWTTLLEIWNVIYYSVFNELLLSNLRIINMPRTSILIFSKYYPMIFFEFSSVLRTYVIEYFNNFIISISRCIHYRYLVFSRCIFMS